MKLNKLFFILTLLAVGFVSCKRKGITPDEPKTDSARAILSRDSIFLYAKQIYLWKDELPTIEAFNPQQFTGESTDLKNYVKELVALTQYAKNPVTKVPYEFYANGTDSKYSYISDLADKNPTAFIPEKKSAVDLEGNGNDFGLKLGAYAQDDNGQEYYALFITAVNQNSPADKAGMVRSDRVYKINDRAITANYNTIDRPIIAAALNGNTIKLEGVKYSSSGNAGAPFTVTLTKSVYKSSPLFAKKVFTAGAKKIGYLSYARFSSLSTNSKPELDLAFSEFSAAGVTDLIIDLRYNGGGYVNTAQYFINQIAPASANGKVMFAEHYNSLMQARGATILSNQPLLDANKKVQYQNGRMITYADVDYSVAGNTEVFIKNGPLNTGNTIGKVVFIVSGNTASASELMINSLKPYMEVKLVGSKTFGKPVGFFPITIENKYEVYYSLFQTKNSRGEGDYFDGMIPDITLGFDDPRFNFGNSIESYTALALNEIAPGAMVTSTVKTMSIEGKNVDVSSLKAMKPIADGNEFVGMIETRHKLKK